MVAQQKYLCIRYSIMCLLMMLVGRVYAEEVSFTIDVNSLSGNSGNYSWSSGGLRGTANCSKYSSYIQVSTYNYISNSTALPGNITKVEIIKKKEKQNKKCEWYVSTYDRAITQNNLSSSTKWGTKNINENQTPWTISNVNHSYFYLCVTTASSYDIEKIVITYEPTPQSLTLVAKKNDTYYATFSNSQPTFFPITSGTKVMTAYVEGSSLATSEVSNDEGGVYVPANTGVLISSASSTVSYYYSNAKAEKTVGQNMLCPASQKMSGDYLFYKLAYNNYTNKSGLGFYWGADNGGAFTAKAGGAYLAVPKSAAAKAFCFDDSDETAIDEVTSRSDDEMYNLVGQKVENGFRGVYVKGGKKYIRK